MDSDGGDKFYTLSGTRRGVRMPDNVRRLAYQLWAFECGRNCRAVAHELGIGEYNVERWAKREQWADRANAELAAIMPDLIRQSATKLRLAAYHASRRSLVPHRSGAAPLSGGRCPCQERGPRWLLVNGSRSAAAGGFRRRSSA
jgi:hypothetical protein